MTKPYPSFICQDCGQRYGKRKTPGEATWNVFPCDICGTVDLCTEPRDFGHLIDGWRHHIHYINDGFGNEWKLCDKPDCQLAVVRPGKAECQRCDHWTEQDELDRSKHRSDIL